MKCSTSFNAYIKGLVPLVSNVGTHFLSEPYCYGMAYLVKVKSVLTGPLLSGHP